jgi:hypothetical protein
MAMSDGVTDDVLLAGTRHGPDSGSGVGAPGRHFVLTSRGGHLEWSDGRTTRLWQLPEQTDPADAGLPVVTSILRAEVTLWGRGATPESILALTDQTGHGLAVIARGSQDTLASAWPDTAFSALTARSVTLQRVHFDDPVELSAQHPGLINPLVARFLSRRAFRLRNRVLLTLGVLVAIAIASSILAR